MKKALTEDEISYLAHEFRMENTAADQPFDDLSVLWSAGEYEAVASYLIGAGAIEGRNQSPVQNSLLKKCISHRTERAAFNRALADRRVLICSACNSHFWPDDDDRPELEKCDQCGGRLIDNGPYRGAKGAWIRSIDCTGYELGGRIPRQAVADCSGPGPADQAVSYWVDKLRFVAPLEAGRSYLESTGIEDTDLMSAREVAEYVFWLICGDIASDRVNGR